jgi:uncharacterized phiE125 gp8 family phage protein
MALLSYPNGSIEPVAVADARVACRIDGSERDAELAGLISAAREHAEHITSRQYRAQVLRESLAGWPDGTLSLSVDKATAVVITYRSAASPETWATLDAAAYRWACFDGRTLINPADGTSWPDLAPDDYPERVRVDVTSGPADADQVPESVRQYILASIAAWIDQPGALADGRLQPHPLFERLLDRERLWH